MTFFDIDHCKIAIDGNGNFYNMPSHLNGSKISKHIFNVFHLFELLQNLQGESNQVNMKYKESIINSMKFYILKVQQRIKKYVDRGVLFDSDSMDDFNQHIKMIKQHNIIVKSPFDDQDLPKNEGNIWQ